MANPPPPGRARRGGREIDADGLVTQAGALSLDYDPQNGLLTATDLSDTVTAHTYTPRGELDTITVATDAVAMYGADYSYDSLGRVSAVTETIAGTAVKPNTPTTPSASSPR